jgi:hypothetical protein
MAGRMAVSRRMKSSSSFRVTPEMVAVAAHRPDPPAHPRPERVRPDRSASQAAVGPRPAARRPKLDHERLEGMLTTHRLEVTDMTDIIDLSDPALAHFALRWERAKAEARATLVEEAALAAHLAHEDAIRRANEARSERVTPLIQTEEPRKS